MLFFSLFLILTNAKLTLHQQQLHRLNPRGYSNLKSSVQQHEYTVPMDHFNANNFEDFTIKYFLNAEYYNKDDAKAPLFVLLGGEGPESAKVLEGSYVINALAQKHSGLMLAVEHRFYGDSTPSLELNKLRYCTAEQALMDYVEVITHILEEYKIEDHPVIVLGGSYSGNLAAWMRQKYPNVVEGAWASSAPVEASVDFYQYLEVVQSALPKDTPELLQIAFDTWEKMTETAEGRKQLKKIFNTCTEFGEKDIQTFAETIGTALSGYVQYNSSVWKSNYESVDSLCNGFIVDIVKDYPKFIKERYDKEWAGSDCTPSSIEESWASLKNTKTYAEGNDNASGRAWFFQTCSAYGYYQAADNAKSSVKWGKLNKLQGSIDMCKEIYGIEEETIYKAVDHVNVRYGGKKPNVTNVAFMNGKTDPWHALSVTEKEGQEGNLVGIVYISSHCADLYAERETDIARLKYARHQEMRFFEKVLENYQA